MQKSMGLTCIKILVLFGLWVPAVNAQQLPKVKTPNEVYLENIVSFIIDGNKAAAEALIEQIAYVATDEKIKKEDLAKEIQSRKAVLNYLVHLHYYKWNPVKESNNLSLSEISEKFGLITSCPPDDKILQTVSKHSYLEKMLKIKKEELVLLLSNQYRDLSALRSEWQNPLFKKLILTDMDALLDDSRLWQSDYFKIALSLHAEDLQTKLSQRLNTADSVMSKLANNTLNDPHTKTLIESALLFRNDLIDAKTPDFNRINLSEVVKEEYKVSLPGLVLAEGQKIKESYRTIPYPKITNTKAKPGGHFFDLFNDIAKKERHIDLLTITGINLESFNLIAIDPGTFMMGSLENKKGPKADENQHEVELTKKTIIQATTVTQLQWYILTGEKPSEFNKREHCLETYNENLQMCPNNPVEKVSWNRIQEFLKSLNMKAKEYGYPKLQFSLPTEAQQEYATRSGTETKYYWGNENSKEIMSQYAWYEENSNDHTHEVGTLKPNAYGLYDMSGNVLQWVADTYEKNYPKTKQIDPFINKTDAGSLRVERGGSFTSDSVCCRSAYRMLDDPLSGWSFVGFRLARTDDN